MVRIATLSLGLLIALTGCAHHRHHDRSEPVVHSRGHGPPPHAPAHGYRHRHRHRHHGDIELLFDAGLGVYVVVGRSDHYFHRDRFYRLLDGLWHRSAHLSEGWTEVRMKDLPPGLAKRHHKAKHRHRRGKSHPAKHR